MGWGYTKKDVIPIIFVFNNSTELNSDDNCAINESVREVFEILRDRQKTHPSCEVKVSIIALAGKRRLLANNVLLDDVYWDDLEPSGDAKWDELSECLDELLYDYLSTTLCDGMITQPIVLFFTTSATVPNEFSINLKQSASIKNIISKFVITPEVKWCDSAKRIVDNIECIFRCDRVDELQTSINFTKVDCPISDRLLRDSCELPDLLINTVSTKNNVAMKTNEQKYILPIVYVIESSDNMAGDRIAAINEAIRETRSIFSEFISEHHNEKIKVAVVKFGDTAEAVTDGFESLCDFEWDDIGAAGKSNIGNAIELLDKDILQKENILKDEETTAYYRPIIFFLTASPSADEYLIKLANADKNVNYHYARKVCVAIGNDCDKDMLVRITGTMEAVISASDLETLKHMLVLCEMPEPDEIEDFLSRKSVNEATKDEIDFIDEDLKMPKLDSCFLPKLVKPVIYMIDTSGSMAGEKIESVKQALEKSREIFQSSAKENFEVLVGVMTFSTGIKWITDDELVSPDNMKLDNINASGCTELGAAIKALEEKFSRTGFFKKDENVVFYAPAIIIVSDGAPTDDWKLTLKQLKENKWFRASDKIAIAIGDDANTEVLTELVGSSHSVFYVDNCDTTALTQKIFDASSSAAKVTLYLSDVLGEKACLDQTDGVDMAIDMSANECFSLEDESGFSIPISSSTDIVRCQMGPCEPEKAQDILFHIDINYNCLNVINTDATDDLYVTFYIDAETERSLFGCNKSVFAVNSVFGEKLDSDIVFEIYDNAILVSNNSSSDIYFSAVMEIGKESNLQNGDTVRKGKGPLFTVKNIKTAEKKEGFRKESADDLSAWDDLDDWQ